MQMQLLKFKTGCALAQPGRIGQMNMGKVSGDVVHQS